MSWLYGIRTKLILLKGSSGTKTFKFHKQHAGTHWCMRGQAALLLSFIAHTVLQWSFLNHPQLNHHRKRMDDWAKPVENRRFKETLLTGSAQNRACKKSTWPRAGRSPCPLWIRASLCLRVQRRTMLRGEHSAAIVSMCVTLDPSSGTSTAAGRRRGRRGDVLPVGHDMWWCLSGATWKCFEIFILHLRLCSFAFRLLNFCHSRKLASLLEKSNDAAAA